MEHFEGYDLLTDEEKNVYDHLKKVKADSLWKPAIECVIRFGDPLTFLRLVLELKSQAKDNPNSMKRMLGDAYKPVIKL